MKRAASFNLRFRLRRGSRETLQAQLLDQLRVVLTSLEPAARLPSTRALAMQLGVSRNTVLNVYEELAGEGLLAGKTGSGTRVNARKVMRGPLADVRLDISQALRESHYPSAAVHFHDPDGNGWSVQQLPRRP